MIKRQRKKQRSNATFRMTARRPIRKGIWGAVGYYVLLCNSHQAAEVADSHSPAFIQHQYREVLMEQHITRTRDATQIRTRQVKSH